MKYDLNDYMFDLQGFLILKNAVSSDHIAELNESLDNFPVLEMGQWHGNVQRNDNNGNAGAELQNIVEAGAPFEKLIDHPAWIERLKRYCGEQGTYVEGLFIDECFASIRKSGGYFPVHSGGHGGIVRNQFRFVNGLFRCAQVNILVALTDIGPGDGGTMIIPGSHKSNIEHPCFSTWEKQEKMDALPGAIEVHLKKGDALMFVDAVSHGASSRTNPGERRAVIYRYGPQWGSTRHGYEYSDQLLSRLTEERRKILRPIAKRFPPSENVAVTAASKTQNLVSA